MSAIARAGATGARLLISCPDRPGIVAAVSGFLFEHGANIVYSDQHSLDPEGGRFFMRMEFTTDALDLGREELAARFAREVAEGMGMDWHLFFADQPKRVAMLVSREEHCLLELLWRNRRGELDAQIELVASNHPGPASALDSRVRAPPRYMRRTVALSAAVLVGFLLAFTLLRLLLDPLLDLPVPNAITGAAVALMFLAAAPHLQRMHRATMRPTQQ